MLAGFSLSDNIGCRSGLILVGMFRYLVTNYLSKTNSVFLFQYWILLNTRFVPREFCLFYICVISLIYNHAYCFCSFLSQHFHITHQFVATFRLDIFNIARSVGLSFYMWGLRPTWILLRAYFHFFSSKLVRTDNNCYFSLNDKQLNNHDKVLALTN